MTAPCEQVALTHVSLVSKGMDRQYPEDRASLLDLSAGRRRSLQIYKMIFCLDLLSEFGHKFNRETALEVGDGFQRLHGLLESLLG